MEIREFAREEWPTGLLEIPQPPEKLWIRGSMPPVGTRMLTVVGSRALSGYGRQACEKLIHGLAGYPISIVSGLALGADACAHQAALDAGLHTIAVFGSGLGKNVIYPRTNVRLADNIIAAGGAHISEHPEDHVARAFDFPARNRIAVGLAHAVLVIEAGEKSGTLITARLASEYNRDLLCVPHRIGDPHGFGSHLFIRIGAALVTEPIHILEALGIAPAEDTRESGTPRDLNDTETVVWGMLEEPLTRDELLRRSKVNAGDVLTALVALELRGLAKEEFGSWRRT